MSRLRQALGLAGLILGLAGIGLESRVVVWVAIALLGGSVALRAWGWARARRRDQGPDDAASPPDGASR